MKKTEFNPGETVVCRDASGGLALPHLTEGKKYIVVEFIPKVFEPEIGFTWPACIKVHSDNGKSTVTCHANRFSKLDEASSN